ncbi:SH3 domain-containing protein 19 [Pangasianodon hypophthalmus]|uniref:SH3 domain-containing protein 19 n=1 Tax=Pangasianodon hypophthalmus TaxID=310915 RepID=UPI0023080ED2|nr:SH3 domain-containing protein 19 [Pangasianodon hypophthalmus]XP_026798917.3 SH3 domain-containing protein 19 [Pangasianodon hypophthalmus]XP_026798918.3 SH3 domain-containing protein 19 [Pangasianodon hypophthalmus]XP_026798919.3 SH3 domain-containing protein 19 [Pangasianodon hypophthalmus]XP_034157131.2 SH3 domain-containing protein 19 [Pangasianodon hypophthalmus]
MAALHGERNIRSKIQEFEKQISTDEISIPTPRPRNTTRPALAPKPSMTQRAFISSTTEEETNTQTWPDNNYEEVIRTNSTPVPPSPAQRPQIPRKLSLNSSDQFKAQPLIKPPPQLPSRPSLRRGRTLNSQDEDAVFNTSPFSPRAVHSVINHCSTKENEYVDAPVSHVPSNLAQAATFTDAVSRKPTIIRVPSRQEQEVSDCFPPAFPVQRSIGGLSSSLRCKDSFSSVCDPVLPRPVGGKTPPRRPPPAKPAPGRPPPPRRDSIVRNSTLQSQHSTKVRHNLSKKTPVLPPRPNPGHRLYNKYTLEIPHGIAEYDYNGMHTGELSFQKNEVLVLLNQTDSQTFECQVGNAKGTVQKSYMKIITPLSNYSYRDADPVRKESTSRQAFTNSVENGTLQVQALYDFTPEGPGELGLKAGDIINNVEQLDGEWYLGTSRGITGFFPINYVKTLPGQPAAPHIPAPAPVPAPTPAPAPSTLQRVSGPRCVARFDFEGEHGDELSFTEGQVIRLLEYMGEEWARGEIGGHVGIFPLNFVEVMEDLPPSPAKNQIRVPLPGMAASNNMQTPASTHNQACGVEYVKALYDFTAQTDGDLSFLRGDVIEVIEHIDEEWSHGRLNGREGLFPTSFTQTHTGGYSHR